MKWTAALFLLPLIQSAPEPRRILDPVEPPLRVDLRIGERTVRVAVGSVSPARDGLPEIQVDLVPTRAFEAPNAFTFEYLEQWTFSGGSAGIQGWWSVAHGGAMVHLQRHDGDPVGTRDLYVRNALACWSGATVAEGTLSLGGRSFPSRTVRHHSPGMHGGTDTFADQTIVGFSAGGVSWLLVVHVPLASVETKIEDQVGIEVPITTPILMHDSDRKAELDALVASFRWL